MEDPVEIFKMVITMIIVVYVAFVLIQQFSQDIPEFGKYGWYIFGALVVGVTLAFKNLFR